MPAMFEFDLLAVVFWANCRGLSTYGPDLPGHTLEGWWDAHCPTLFLTKIVNYSKLGFLSRHPLPAASFDSTHGARIRNECRQII